MVECNKYFPGKKMHVNGVIMTGTGIGSMTFGMFAYSYLNPEKLKPLDGYYLGTPELEDIAVKVPTLLRILALLYLITGALAIALLTPTALHNRKVENEHK